jgi:uridylate kinase
MVIKVGGSLFYNEKLEINVNVLVHVKKWYEKYKSKLNNIVFVTGGGKLSREMGEKVKSFSNIEEDIHSVSMEATQLNSQILKAYLNDKSIYVPQRLGDAYEYLIGDGKGRAMVSGGLKHGWSTDMDAAIFADILKEKKVYKLTDVEGVYTDDPKLSPSAKIIEDITWDEFMQKFGISKTSKHTPNLHVPVSAESAIFCETKGITMYIAGGKNINNENGLENVFESGTKIHP